jgi:hypothetical protein
MGHWALVLSVVEVLGTCTERSRSIGHWALGKEEKKDPSFSRLVSLSNH